MLVYIKTTIIAIVAIFTVTFLFGFISSDTTTLNNAPVDYYFQEDPNDEDAWMEEINWSAPPPSGGCDDGDIPCRITLDNNEDLQEFLDSFGDSEALLKDHQVESKR